MRFTQLILALLLAVPSFAVNRYIATTGTDTGGCTSSGSPCLTFEYAYLQSDDGDTVKVKAGNYGNQVIDQDNTNVTTTPVTFQLDDGLSFRDAGWCQMEISNADFITFIEMENYNCNGRRTYLLQGADRITFQDCHIRRLHNSWGTNISFLGGEIGDYTANGSVPRVGQIGGSSPGFGSPVNTIFDGVWFHDVNRSDSLSHNEPLQVYGADGLIIRNSIFSNCSNGTDQSICIRMGGGDGDVDGVHRNYLIENNFIEFPVSTFAVSFQIYRSSNNNTGAPFENIIIRNNSFTGTAIADLQAGEDKSQIKFYNNIIHDATSLGGDLCSDNATWAYNHFETGTTCGDANASTGAITYVDESSNPIDLHLVAGDTAVINTGNNATCSTTDIDGHPRPANSTCDRGADEYGGEAGTPPAPPRNLRIVN